MPCYAPIKGYRHFSGKVISRPVDAVLSRSGEPQTAEAPCGRCIGCRLERSRQWAVRCVHELHQHEESAFLTLTYDDSHLPKNGSLEADALTLFFKRYRKSLESDDIKIRYFACGEYGEKYQRPHYHAIVFGHRFDDPEPVRNQSSAFKIYTSDKLSKLWKFGNVSFGDVTFESCAYVAKYCIDKLNGEPAKLEYDDKGRIAPFVRMSRRPGIASSFFDRYRKTIYPRDEVVVRGKVCKPPKYYDQLQAKMEALIVGASSASVIDQVKEKRQERAERKADKERALSPGRELVKYQVATARMKEFSRNLT